ncbi:hypothetical protein ACTVPV_15790 [Serratia bockelmannii]|uniref:hypothetical protein n=1 Tax=Serratia bockelmannii TaxID=2703793 RepID=UPI003FA6D5B8
MEFDANTHRCTIVIDQQLPAGLAMNSEIVAMPFSALAQSCKTYAEYGECI